MVKARKTAICALLLSLALALHLAETLLPPLFMLPGIKPGLANIVTMLAFISLGITEALVITALRIIIGGIMSGSVISLLYSTAGGTASFLCLILLCPLLKESLPTLSVTAAFIHNLAQVTAAFFITGTAYVFWYIFPLTASAVLCGLFTGYCARIVIKHDLFRKLNKK